MTGVILTDLDSNFGVSVLLLRAGGDRQV